MSHVITQSFSLRSPNEAVQKQPLDDRYGPWETVADATKMLCIPNQSRVYYGMTIGVYTYDDESLDPNPELMGVDEYWWQPKCVWDSSLNGGEGGWVDGFVRKYRPNTIANSGDVLIEDDHSENRMGVDWGECSGAQEWNSLGGNRDSSEIVDSLFPG